MDIETAEKIYSEQSFNCQNCPNKLECSSVDDTFVSEVFTGDDDCTRIVYDAASTIIAARDQRIAELENQLAELSTENLNNVCERDKAKVKLQMCEKERDEARRDAATALDKVIFLAECCESTSPEPQDGEINWARSKLEKYKDAK